MKNKSYLKACLFIAVIAAVIALYCDWRKNARESRYVIVNGAQLTNLKITDPLYQGVTVDFSYEADGKTYCATRQMKLEFAHIALNLIGHTFPVVYQRDSPASGVLLIFPEQFRQLRKPYPDSLHQLLERLMPGTVRPQSI